jgi:YHS domain-containing protein
MIAINKYCPRSGKPVVADSLTTYRGHTVGFCNPHCRDDFQANAGERPNDSRYFDAVIQEHDLDARSQRGA